MSHFYDLEKAGIFGIQKIILWTLGHTSLKPIKLGQMESPHYMEASGQLHILATLTPVGEALVPTEQERLGWPQGQSGHFGEEINLLPLAGFKLWMVQPIS